MQTYNDNRYPMSVEEFENLQVGDFFEHSGKLIKITKLYKEGGVGKFSGEYTSHDGGKVFTGGELCKYINFIECPSREQILRVLEMKSLFLGDTSREDIVTQIIENWDTFENPFS